MNEEVLIPKMTRKSKSSKKVRISFLNLALIIFCLDLYIKILLSRYINDICVKEQKPAAAVKCWYQIFHKEIIILQKWAGIDMNMAVYMCNDYAYEYALRLVDQIWENNLNINKKGNYRMKYIFVKYRCLRGLGQC